MISSEKNESIKKHLLKQIINLPESQKKTVQDKIESLNPEEMEEFLHENNLESLLQEKSENMTRCIFCAITNNEITSYKIDENQEAMAVLEINPLSRGHMIILPKSHTPSDKLNDKTTELAKKVSEMLKKKFNPKEIRLSKNEILEHGAIELVPIYGDEKERRKASEQELKELKELILAEDKKIEEKIEQIKPIEKIELPKLKPRIP